jgi:hypothetical protein
MSIIDPADNLDPIPQPATWLSKRSVSLRDPGVKTALKFVALQVHEDQSRKLHDMDHIANISQREGGKTRLAWCEMK